MNEQSTESTPPSSGWHLKKEFQLGHIITSMVMLVSVLSYVGTIERRLSIVETQQIAQRERDDRQDLAAREAVGLVRSDIQTLSSKLDRLLERTR